MHFTEDYFEHLRTHWNDYGSWLVYADWLMEQEQPRGELLMLELRIEQLKNERYDSRSFRSWRVLDKTLDEMQGRARALLDRHRMRWVYPLQPVPPRMLYYVYRRAWLWSGYLEWAPRAGKENPDWIQRWNDFVVHDNGRFCSGLTLLNDEYDTDLEYLQRLDLRHIERLDLSALRPPREQAFLLAHIKMPKLRDLDITDWVLSETAIEAILRAPWFDQIEDFSAEYALNEDLREDYKNHPKFEGKTVRL